MSVHEKVTKYMNSNIPQEDLQDFSKTPEEYDDYFKVSRFSIR